MLSGIRFGAFGSFWAHSSYGTASFVEDQAVEIVSQVSQSQFGVGTREADGANKQSEPVFLVSEVMFNPGTDG